jgi:predicted RNA-binding Zn-ribbon protein involved in translation (DUF1610 family)
MTAATSTAERQPAEKATLFCPDCGHDSCINGDWIIHVLADSLSYECPHCGTIIDSRQREHALDAGSGGSLQFAAEN